MARSSTLARNPSWSDGLHGSLTTRPPTERLSPVDTAKFTIAVALFAILADAAVGHALAWENDPYWTYWITKTFLIATVFGLGTAWLGIGAGRGAILTAVHTVVLTVYYWSLSPIGLPSQPSWLDLEHTWLSGVPIHFGVIYLGYLTALWLWRHTRLRDDTAPSETSALAWRSLVAGLVIVVGSGLLEAVALWEFQGLTWYVVRLLITVPFLLVWQSLAGRDLRSAVGGAVVLSAVLLAYSHFLGPLGLPDWPIRIFERGAPGATVHWLTYRQEALVALPITFAVALAVFLALRVPSDRQAQPYVRRRVGVFAAGVVVLVIAGALAAPSIGGDAEHATVTASGTARGEQGPFYRGPLAPATGSLQLYAVQRNPRVTPLPPHNTVRLSSRIDYPDGSTYRVTATRPMVEDALGRFTTWWGVGFDVWHHGRSGIGSDRVPATDAKVAVFALGQLERDGTLLATNVPVHAMTMDGGRVELDVGDPAAAIPGLPNGHLRVVWNDVRIDKPVGAKVAHYVIGVLVVLALLALVGWAIATEPRRPDDIEALAR